MRSTLTAALLALSPAMAFAAGSETDTPPTPTETTEICEEGLIWDIATETCLPLEQSTNDDNAMMEILRELAYNGRYADARAVLDQLNPADSMVQTYYGFTARKMGDTDGAMAYYTAALQLDPDNTLARSYMGQGLVALGDMAGAQTQLSEIRARGGRQTWAELSLRMALEQGVAPAY